MDDKFSQCQNLQDYPVPIAKATGGLIQDKYPLICGGALTDSCYVIGKSSEIIAQLNEKRYEAASVVLSSNKLWITGGYNLDHRIKTTEMVELSQSGEIGISSYGPNLPIPLFGHSMVLINETLAMVIGGTTDINSARTWFFNVQSQSWSNGPELQKARAFHASAVITDTETGIQYVVVAGGTNTVAGDLSSVELLAVPSGTAWRTGIFFAQ